MKALKLFRSPAFPAGVLPGAIAIAVTLVSAAPFYLG